VLVGRDRELEQIAALLDEARRGRSGTLVVVGEAGLGKSALLAEGRRLASDLRVLAATGVESESELAFASLHELLRPALYLVSRLPRAQARSLAAALALEDGDPDALSVRAATLSLLVEAAEESPVLVVVDDAHWLDGASADALAFAARRLRAEEIAVLAAVRPDATSAFDSFPHLQLAPLADDDARRLLRRRAEPVPAADETRLLAASAGNPLALLELSVELAGELPRSATSLDRLRRTFLPRLHELPEAARLGLLIAAAESDTRIVWRAAEALGVLEPLTHVDATGLARIDGQRVVFRHPVVRSILYAEARAAERRAVHRALADVLAADTDTDSDRRAWHLAAAAEGPDDEVAALLEATAARAASRGGRAAEASALERAARLSLDPDDVSRRLANAASAAASAGDADRAIGLAEEAVASAHDPLVRARAVVEQAGVLGRASPRAYDQERFLAAIGHVERLEPDYATRALQQIVNRSLEALDLDGARQLVGRLEQIAQRASSPTREQGLAGTADVYLAGGDAENFERLFSEFRHSTRALSGSAVDLVWAEKYDTVAHALEADAREARSSGNLLGTLWNDACLAHLEVRLGRLHEAKLAASRAVTLAEAYGFRRFGLVPLCALASVHAWQGEADACKRTAAEALTIVRDGRLVLFEFSARASLGLLAVGAGRPVDAIDVLASEAKRWAATELVEPSIVPFVPDLVEAYAVTGRHDEAGRWLERFSAAARTAGRIWALAACARCEGLLASAEAFDEPFLRALELHEHSPMALERARTQLAYGERLRRQKRKEEARIQLRAANETFAAVSATPWHKRARAELRATGERVLDDVHPIPEPDAAGAADQHAGRGG
jgi:hypothetical protein